MHRWWGQERQSWECRESKRAAILSGLTTHPSPTYPAQRSQFFGRPLLRDHGDGVCRGALQPEPTNASRIPALMRIKSKPGTYPVNFSWQSRGGRPRPVTVKPAVRLLLQRGHCCPVHEQTLSTQPGNLRCLTGTIHGRG